MRVDDLFITEDISVLDAMRKLDETGLGVLFVAPEGVLRAVVTDGDIRRGFAKSLDSLNKPVSELMTKSPKTITARKLAAEALHLMESNKPHPITILPVVDEEKKVVGLLHMTDLVHQGVV